MYYNFRWIVYSAWLGQFYLPSTILDQISCFWLTYKILIEALQYYYFLNIAKKRLKDNSLEVDKTPKYLCLSAQFYPTLCDSMDCSLPGPSIHGVFQATVLEWIAILLLWGIFLTQGSDSCLLCLLHWQADALPLCHLRNRWLRIQSFYICM